MKHCCVGLILAVHLQHYRFPPNIMTLWHEKLTTLLALWWEFTGNWWILLTKGQKCRAFMFLSLLAGTKFWKHNWDTGDLRHHDIYVEITLPAVFFSFCSNVINHMGFVNHKVYGFYNVSDVFFLSTLQWTCHNTILLWYNFLLLVLSFYSPQIYVYSIWIF